jgi:Trk K+ transport system NAD-binding subunit
LRAQELNPDLRLVISSFNRQLGEHMGDFLRDYRVLSDSQMAGPAFVAAALGELAPSHVRVSGRTLHVARQRDVSAGQAVCGLRVPDDPADTTLLIPPEELAGDGENLVLAVADGAPRNPLARKRHPGRDTLKMGRRIARNRFALICAVFLALVMAGAVGLLLTGYSVNSTLYLTAMDMIGVPLTSVASFGLEKWSQTILKGASRAVLPLLTAIIVGARLIGTVRGERRPSGSGHVIVSGLGDVGTQVVSALYDLGFEVACIDHDPGARGIEVARSLGLPVVIGEASQERTLRAAGLETSIALVSATSSDMVNLEIAFQARAMRADVRIVLRLFDDNLAQRVQQTLGNVVSHSVSSLAAPVFAVALLEHQVLRTISLGRHVLLIADIRVTPGADIVGQALAELELDRQARVLALQVRGASQFDWSPHHGYLLAPSDRVIVLATQGGLHRFLAGNGPTPRSL